MASFDQLYNSFGSVVKKATGRNWWRKDAIQSPPVGPYATIFLAEADGIEKDVVEVTELDAELVTGETMSQEVWGVSLVQVQIEFFRSAENDSARDAVTRMRAALNLVERFFDIWKLCGLSSGLRITDIGGMFRADVEPRTRLTFTIYANISSPKPLVDNDINEIETQEISVTEVIQDGSENTIPVIVTKL